MDKLKIAGTGLTGLVGSRIVELLGTDFDFIPITSTDMDICKPDEVNKKLYEIDFDIFLHAAAYTSVDGAEVNEEIARKINVEGTKNVFEVVTNKRKKFIYISTDFVFDGTTGNYDEESVPNPISAYGKTKYEGEKIVGKDGMIMRISYPYRARFDEKKDFVRTIISMLSSSEQFNGVTDQILTLTFIDDIAYAFKHLFQNYSSEIYHIVGGDSLSGFDSIMTIAEVFGLSKEHVGKIVYDQFYESKAKRPRNGTMISKKNSFYPMKNLRDGLGEMKKQLS
ncbi:hypothetical protein A3D80_01120 [Candidatus Roizmanbacteria bacterium RIFCSPHIGHO2_02_FULL_40_13b]|uniref:dTDP-4-dehydrorhamnose reductase n=1 Tax=Candidatus Roizmanbacteria bacterium RIFCSPHIGHO2_01_FULL_39_24 TaxID=1802032 RepID=A0A1F7GL52_9BACT|nr:MAG: hypothetical protein A2799_01260 [Candidatus Roizmanbacteria bacterium RIFCSPHIGHO2_01_FULL_39_24]OGK26297.1 MAG: hypothetical protein A3D80_01120 [Candidatus Roizmanbacteria bacterium RIFCSPHIGHO2_02_FULL_40_13b]OGK49360.1 MAG: hypothetical protein A3A56_03750 [Candidatus Roizmanbacteria bacterium RIFCSPLOWO2_01_FULL_40_32]